MGGFGEEEEEEGAGRFGEGEERGGGEEEEGVKQKQNKNQGQDTLTKKLGPKRSSSRCKIRSRNKLLEPLPESPCWPLPWTTGFQSPLQAHP